MIYNEKLIFVHIPKTSGGVVSYNMKRYMNARSYKSTHYKINKNDLGILHGRYSFAIVRNVWKAISSCWRFRYEGFRKMTDPYMDFDEFIEWNNREKFLTHQSAWFTDKGEIIIDEVIDYDDNREEKIIKIFEDNGYNQYDFTKKEKMNHYYGTYDYRDYYTPERIKKVAEYAQNDIELFNWRYE